MLIITAKNEDDDKERQVGKQAGSCIPALTISCIISMFIFSY